MILTGKTKEHFLKWVYSEYDYKYEHLKDFYPLHLLDGLIIEWFDSVGIYVSVFKDFEIFEIYINDDWAGGEETRKEATEQAIKKANEIYNIQQ